MQPTKIIVLALIASGMASVANARDTHADGVDISDGDAGIEDLYVDDEAVIDGVLCVGNTCSSGIDQDSNLQVLRLDYTRPHLYFHDNSGVSSPANDWRIRINDNETIASGGLTRFVIEDMTGGTLPFVIRAGAPSNSFWIEPSGNVGLGTSIPDASLHIIGDDGTTQLHVEEASATPANNRILALFENNGAAQFSLVDNDIGSDWRFQNFDGEFRISKAGTGLTELSLDDAGFLTVGNDGNAQLALINHSSGADWRFQNFDNNFRITKAGTGQPELDLDGAGNLTIAGTLTQGSDKYAKMAIEPVDPAEILAKVSALPVAEWSYIDAEGVRHVGPMAQDFHALFGLGATETGISTLDTSGVALAAIQALAAENTRLEAALKAKDADQDALIEGVLAENGDLKALVAGLTARLDAMERSYARLVQ